MEKEHFTPGLPGMQDIAGLPFIHKEGTETRQFSSHDPSGGNNDGNFTKSYTKYIDSNGEYVIFDASGPGCLYRQQYNIWWIGRFKDPGKTHIKYYFDDESSPRIDVPINDFFGGKISPFTAPFSFLDSSFRFGNLYYPLPFRKRLKITTTYDLNRLSKDGSFYPASWYQYTYLTYAKDTDVQSWSKTSAKAPDEVIRQWENTGADPKSEDGNINLTKTVKIRAGEHATMAEIKGEGAIAGIHLYLHPYNRDLFYHTHLRIYWDNAKTAAVDLPLSSFFGSGGETYKNCEDIHTRTLKTLLYGYNGQAHTFYSYWPMPYWESARIELWNDSQTNIDSLQLNIAYKPAGARRYPRESAGYFYAKRTIAQDTGKGTFATVFRENGSGHVVGLSFYSNNYAMDGDEFTYIDGSHTAQIHGDGTEDDHNQGWGGDAYQKPLWGGLINGYQGAYRLYLNDAYIFNHDIKINYEYSYVGGHDYGGQVDAVVYYYKSALPGDLVLTDALDIGDPKSEAAHDYKISGKTWEDTKLSGYDGYERNYEYDRVRDDGYGYNGSGEFVARISPDNKGIRIRRRIYRSGNGIQRANVYVDGVKVTERPWDICTLSSAPYYQGWYDTDFEIPASYTRGKHAVRIRIEYLKGDGSGADINAFYYWIYSYSGDMPAAGNPVIKNLRVASGKDYGVRLSWETDQPGLPGRYFRIFRSSNPDFSDPEPVGSSNTYNFTDKRVLPETRYYYRIAAGPEPEQDRSQTVSIKTAALPLHATAQFLQTDTSTRENWFWKYGSEGFLAFNFSFERNARALPDYISGVEYGNFENHPGSFVSVGGLETKDTGSITLYVNDSRQHSLGVYLYDFDKKGRSQQIEISDLKGNPVAPRQVVDDFKTSRWLLYRFSGSIRIRLTNRQDQGTAVISALTFDQPNP
ncbi:hypothetical protein GCM10023143_10540 [Compostibacter hankyongensis]|uniref:DUF2961 domain-containing protein n=2 Tax=Compostibacter hankyongensis TaxID=1007089 RepID=A0ABP8FJM6_9BACT